MPIRLEPFCAVRYDPAVAGDPGRLISPPYDVIDEQCREELFARSEFNVARVIRADASDGYAAAAKTARQWLASGVLKRDASPALYVYEQRFQAHGRELRRTGIVGLVGLEEDGGVMPHERTLSSPRADRLNLLRATRMTFGQVFALFRDEEGASDQVLDRAKESAPLLDAEADELGHKVWALTDSTAVRALQKVLDPKRLLIADGHHRWETARAFMAERPDLPGARFRMMTLVNMASPDLAILPFHRVLKGVQGYSAEALLKSIEGDFCVTAFGEGVAARRRMAAAMRSARGEGRPCVGLYPGDRLYRVAALKDESALAGERPALARLDVTVLHRLILEKALGVCAEAQEAGANLIYLKDIEGDPAEAAALVDRGEGQAAFFLNPCTPEDVEAVALAGERMPQKATFFYPKVYSGVVMHDLE